MSSIRQALAAAAAFFACSAACAETHALIMAISDYRMPGATALKGVVHDIASAQEIARRLGVTGANMVVLRDGELTLDGMTRAFDDLQNRVAQNDNVFIYYSGHGGRQRVRDPEERCAESLVTVDGYGFLDATLESRLKELALKANKLVVFVDACHSGGVTTRGKGDSRFVAKYFAREGEDACEVPVNVLKRSINIGTRAAGSGAQNYVYIAAARDNEVSLDEADRGGVATQAWRECVTGAARDLDGSGAISADEVRVCAQQVIDKKLRNVPGFSPHHISIVGNSRASLGLVAAAAPAETPASPAETLKDIYAQRDDRRTVTLELREPRLRIGRDPLRFTVTSSHPGYLYLLMAGSDGKSFDMLFPNRIDQGNEIAAGQALELPRSRWQVTAAGPQGTSQLLAIVTDARRDFSALGMQAAGPFSILAASQTAARDIQLVTTTAPLATNPECADPVGRRNLVVARRCSHAYGAALVNVEEVR